MWRNGTRPKTVLTEATGHVQLDVPRDRDGSFDPVIAEVAAALSERGRRDRVVAVCARVDHRGDLGAHFAQIYGASVSKETISRITDKVVEEMTDWANRPLDGAYAAVFIDAIAGLGP
jgi:putative transposase